MTSAASLSRSSATLPKSVSASWSMEVLSFLVRVSIEGVNRPGAAGGPAWERRFMAARLRGAGSAFDGGAPQSMAMRSSSAIV
jgi:hypothetical protein